MLHAESSVAADVYMEQSMLEYHERHEPEHPFTKRAPQASTKRSRARFRYHDAHPDLKAADRPLPLPAWQARQRAGRFTGRRPSRVTISSYNDHHALGRR
jgi:hypothetical protein